MPQPDEELKECWVCETEECGLVYEGVNPPDACRHCGGAMFDNLYDLLAGAPPVLG